MRRGRTIIFVVLIIIIGLVVGVVALQSFVGSNATATPVAPQFVEVYVVAQKIPQGSDITVEALGKMSIPADAVMDIMIKTTDTQSLQNKVASFNLEPGMPLTTSMMVDKSSGVSIPPPQWTMLIPPGMTAITIPATRLSVAGYGASDGAHVNVNACLLFVDIDPGFQSVLPNSTGTLTGTGFIPDKLPVLSMAASATSAEAGGGGPQGRLELDPSLQQPFYLVPSETQRPRVVCQTILQNVVVMKLGNFGAPETASQPIVDPTGTTDPTAAAQPVIPEETQPKPDIVTLIVLPQDSIILSYLVYTNAQIMLVPRNPSDQARQATEAATLQFLLSQYNIPIPAKLPYALEPRIDELLAPSLPNDVVEVPPQ